MRYLNIAYALVRHGQEHDFVLHDNVKVVAGGSDTHDQQARLRQNESSTHAEPRHSLAILVCDLVVVRGQVFKDPLDHVHEVPRLARELGEHRRALRDGRVDDCLVKFSTGYRLS